LLGPYYLHQLTYQKYVSYNNSMCKRVLDLLEAIHREFGRVGKTAI